MSPPTESLTGLRLLADETRWSLVRALRDSDQLVNELVSRTGLAQNLVSYHLGVLRQAGLVQLHKSDADARATYYGINLPALHALYRQLGIDLALPTSRTAPPLPALSVVFLCRANSARSQLAEAWLRALSGGQLTVHSAGTQPTRLHPLTLQVMHEVGLDLSQHQAKHADDLALVRPDVVVTVCDLAREECALWQQATRRLHWSIADPVAVKGPEAQLAAFRVSREQLRQRCEGLLELLVTLDLLTQPE